MTRILELYHFKCTVQCTRIMCILYIINILLIVQFWILVEITFFDELRERIKLISD